MTKETIEKIIRHNRPGIAAHQIWQEFEKLKNPPPPTKEDFIKLYTGYEFPEQISAKYIQLCECKDFKERFEITIDDQDLREWGATKCPYCKTPFKLK